MLKDGLKDRAITRDINWGIPIPLPSLDDKRIYVWFEAVIGYLSASIEWAKNRGTPEKWRDFWGGRGEDILFHRQGQHPLPHDHLARDPARLRRPGHPL